MNLLDKYRVYHEDDVPGVNDFIDLAFTPQEAAIQAIKDWGYYGRETEITQENVVVINELTGKETKLAVLVKPVTSFHFEAVER